MSTRVVHMHTEPPVLHIPGSTLLTATAISLVGWMLLAAFAYAVFTLS